MSWIRLMMVSTLSFLVTSAFGQADKQPSWDCPSKAPAELAAQCKKDLSGCERLHKKKSEVTECRKGVVLKLAGEQVFSRDRPISAEESERRMKRMTPPNTALRTESPNEAAERIMKAERQGPK